LPAGDLTKTAAWIIFAALAAGVAAILAFQILNTLAVLMLGTYLAVNLSYSLGLKDFAVLEMFLVASGFVIRVIAGAVAIEVPFTDWILVCTGLLALLVVSGKRRADLVQEGDGTKEAEIYTVNFLDHIISIFASVTVIYYVFFCFSEYAKGKFGPLVLLTSVFVGFGIFRFVYLIMVRNVGDNPTLLVLKDNGMRITALCWTALFAYLIYFR
jgi:4-hydroxybenzoate polyprenyltransferase